MTIEGPNRNGLPAIRLDPMAVSPGSHVTLETRDEKGSGLTIKIAGQESFNLTVHEPVKLIVQHAEVRGLADSPFQKNEELTYRVRLPERASWIEIAAQPDGPVLAPTFSSGQSATPIFSGIPVATLDFTRQKSSGERVSALTGQGTITFPGLSASRQRLDQRARRDWFGATGQVHDRTDHISSGRAVE